LAGGVFGFSMLIVNHSPLNGDKECIEEVELPPFVHPKVSTRLTDRWKLPGKYDA